MLRGNDVLPRQFGWFVAALCVLPLVLKLAGMEFGSAQHMELMGSLLHNLLEWTGVCLAILAACIAFVHFWMTRSLLTPILGAALLWSGCMDAFHTLASDHFIRRVAEVDRFIPLTWTASRLFGCLVLLAGAAIVLAAKPGSRKRDIRWLVLTLFSFGAASFAVVSYCGHSSHLPKCQFPGSWVPRPYDLIPVILYLAIGLPLFGKLCRRFPGPFSYSLMIGIIPLAASEAYMAFGSSSLYDSNFNIAHFLKIVAYAVPLSGLLLDYVRTYQTQASLLTELAKSARFLEEERRILQLVTNGASLTEVLDEVCIAVERLADNVLCGILLLDEDRRRLLACAGPNLPLEYVAQISGLEIGESVGACGTAAFHNCTIIVDDIAKDPRFIGIAESIMSYGFRACWSVPVRNSQNAVLGTLALYHMRPAKPSPLELRILEAGAHLAGNALERLLAAEQLSANMQRMALAEKVAGFGIWEIDLAKGILTLSDGAAALTGLRSGPRNVTEGEAGAWLNLENLAGDRTRHSGEYLNEFPLTMPDGAVRWVRNRGRAEFPGTPRERITGALIDITHQKQMLLGLEEARAGAERALSVKDQFLANMSHELRTPLNGIIGMIALLADSGVTPEQEQYIGTIHQCGETLLHLINDILDLAKIEAGKIVLERADFDLRRLVSDVAAILRPAAEARDLLFIEETGDSPVWVSSDSQRLKQVLLNLLSNAVKFTHAGTVSMELCVLESTVEQVSVRFVVRDSGIGIRPDAQQAIFEPFMQADSSTTRSYGGTGLGLSICCKLISIMGGALRVESEPGQGSVFWFDLRLPLAQRCDLAQPDPHPRIPTSLANLRILLAEDNAVNQIVAVRLLQRMGHRVDVAGNGLEAVAAVESDGYDLILMDCQMPEMDGFAATRAIRQSSRGRLLPIFAMTANVMAEDRQQCEQAGMNGFVAKPISVQSLYLLLEQLAPTP